MRVKVYINMCTPKSDKVNLHKYRKNKEDVPRDGLNQIERHFIFLVKVSGNTSYTRVFVRFSTLISPFYKMLFMNRLEFSSMLCRVPGS